VRTPSNVCFHRIRLGPIDFVMASLPRFTNISSSLWFERVNGFYVPCCPLQMLIPLLSHLHQKRLLINAITCRDREELCVCLSVCPCPDLTTNTNLPTCHDVNRISYVISTWRQCELVGREQLYQCSVYDLENHMDKCLWKTSNIFMLLLGK